MIRALSNRTSTHILQLHRWHSIRLASEDWVLIFCASINQSVHLDLDYKKISRRFCKRTLRRYIVTIMISWDVRNVEKHELISNYLGTCAMLFIKPNFEHWLNECQLTRLFKYRKASIHILEKIFIYYVEHGQNPIKHI